MRHALHDPEVRVVREHAVSIHVQPIKNDVKRGVTSLERAKKMISSDQEILGGAPCFKGTRIPVHDIAEMLTNEDDLAEVLAAYLGLRKGKWPLPQPTPRPILVAVVRASVLHCQRLGDAPQGRWSKTSSHTR